MTTGIIDYPLFFNGVDLQAAVPGLQITGIDPEGLPEQEINIASIASSNQSALVSKYYKKRYINVHATIRCPRMDLLQASFDTLKSITRGNEKPLVIDQAGARRQYIASLEKLNIDEKQGGYATFVMPFICTYPFGSDVVLSNALSIDGISAAFRASYMTLGGTAPQRPIITVTINAVTGGTNSELSIGITETSQTITVSRTYTAGDVLVINSENSMVTVNGTEVEFTGPILELDPGAYTLTYHDTFTTRDVDIRIDYHKRYL